MLSIKPETNAESHSSRWEVTLRLPWVSDKNWVANCSIMPTSTMASTVIKSPTKNMRVDHSTSSRTLCGSMPVMISSKVAPERAMVAGSRCKAACSKNATRTRFKITRDWTSSFLLVIKPSVSKSRMRAAPSGTCICFRNCKYMIPT